MKIKKIKSRKKQTKLAGVLFLFVLILLVCLTLISGIGRLDRFDSGLFKQSSGASQNIVLGKLPPSDTELEKLNVQLVDVDDILLWVSQQFPNKVLQVTSFAPSGLVILHKLDQLGLLQNIPVVTIDTLHLFPETYDHINVIRRKFDNMKLHVFKPHFENRESFDDYYGSDLWQRNPDVYALRSKVEPLDEAFNALEPEAWLTGRRRSQGGERRHIKVVEVDKANPKRLKINPLASWTYEEVWNYIRRHKIPYNPLHDKGYLSIGDVMNTMPVEPGRDERSGRFVGLNRTECGMHTHLQKIKKLREEAEREHREFNTPTLPCEHCIDVNPDTFDDIVLHGKSDLLVEFYSPFCEACQEFAPTIRRVAKITKERHNVEIVRFDITENDIPEYAKEFGFNFDATPTLFFVGRSPASVSRFENEHDEETVLNWLAEKLVDRQ